MKTNRRLVSVFYFLVFSFVATWNGLVFGSAVEDDDYARSTLRGLQGVYVAVEPLDREVEASGLTTAGLKTDTELRLRMKGIPVLSKEQWTKTQGGPLCYVEVNIVDDAALGGVLDFRLYAFEVRIEFNQDVFLVRDTAVKALSPTWSTSYLGVTNSLPRIRDKVREMVGRFVDAYLEANPIREIGPGPDTSGEH